MTATKKMWGRRVKDFLVLISGSWVLVVIRNFIFNPPHALKTVAVLLAILVCSFLLPFPTLEMYCKLLIPSLIVLAIYHKISMYIHSDSDASDDGVLVGWYAIGTPVFLMVLFVAIGIGSTREAPKAIIIKEQDNACYVEKLKHRLIKDNTFHATIGTHMSVKRACGKDVEVYRNMLNLGEVDTAQKVD